jgi:hypothetical protein
MCAFDCCNNRELTTFAIGSGVIFGAFAGLIKHLCPPGGLENYVIGALVPMFLTGYAYNNAANPEMPKKLYKKVSRIILSGILATASYFLTDSLYNYLARNS